jgi:hypothetical protein
VQEDSANQIKESLLEDRIKLSYGKIIYQWRFQSTKRNRTQPITRVKKRLQENSANLDKDNSANEWGEEDIAEGLSEPEEENSANEKRE